MNLHRSEENLVGNEENAGYLHNLFIQKCPF